MMQEHQKFFHSYNCLHRGSEAEEGGSWLSTQINLCSLARLESWTWRWIYCCCQSANTSNIHSQWFDLHSSSLVHRCWQKENNGKQAGGETGQIHFRNNKREKKKKKNDRSSWIGRSFSMLYHWATEDFEGSSGGIRTHDPGLMRR